MSKPEQSLPPPPFEGFPREALKFFRDLDDHQNKPWFTANKQCYEQFVRSPLQSLVTDVSAQLAKRNSALRGDPNRALFRINRDVRFAKDKRPYNTHASAALTRDGDKQSPGVLYLHIDPAGSFAATGFFRPEPSTLHALRAGLVADPTGWAKVERALLKAGLPLATDDALVRVPKGFEHAPPKLAEVLKMRSWVVRREFSATDIARPSLVDAIVALASDAKPLLNFGWQALRQ
jgi:uncharacterized protein (TIGR02453 family)